MTTVVMAGALQNFDVPCILQAVSLSRQYTTIRLWDRARNETGEIQLKAGQLVGAFDGLRKGKEALRTIIRNTAHHTFRVERTPDPTSIPKPVGSLAGMLLQLSDPPQPPEPKQPVPDSSTEPTHRRSVTVRAIPVKTQPEPKARIAPPPPAPVSPEFLDAVSGLEGLESLVIAGPDEQTTAWCRGLSRIETHPIAGFASAILNAHRDHLGAYGAATENPAVTVELPVGTIVMRHIGSERVGAFLFSCETPVGLAHLLAGQAGAQLGAVLHGTSARHQPAALRVAG